MPKHLIPYVVFFIAFFAAAVPVLYYYQRKNPNPRFRPGFGEMSMVTLIAVFLCGGMAFALGNLFKPENDGKAANKKPDEGAGWSRGTGWNEDKEDKLSDSRKSGKESAKDE